MSRRGKYGWPGRPMQDRFWEKVDILGPDECWEWTSSKMYSGYGTFWNYGRARIAHRIAYELGGEEIPSGMEVMHSCDNRGCCNPSHVRPGTHAENMADSKMKGRTARGVRSYWAKLNDEIVRQIRCDWSNGMSCLKIGAKYGIDQGHAWRVANRKLWAHVD